MFDARKPYNDLPPIPASRLETPATLKAAVAACRSLATLNAASHSIPSPVVLLRAMLLQEARASSAIENVVTTNDALYRALDVEPQVADPATREVLGHGAALWNGYEAVSGGEPLRPSLIEGMAGRIKGVEMGVRSLPGCRIANDRSGEIIYTPPQGRDRLLGLLNDLCAFLADDDGIEPLIKMAAAHRQFEAIHPFSDGNGRTGRVLNILYLVQCRLLDLPILYLSRALLRRRAEYYVLLRAVTEQDAWEPWVVFMMEAVQETADLTLVMLRRVQHAMARSIEDARAGMKRRYSHELLEAVFSQPYTRIAHLEERGVARRNTASLYLRELERVGVLRAVRHGRERLYLNHRLMDALTVQGPGEN